MLLTWMVLQKLFLILQNIPKKCGVEALLVIIMTDGALGELAKVEGDIAAHVQLTGGAGDGNNHLEVGICELKGRYMRNF